MDDKQWQLLDISIEAKRIAAANIKDELVVAVLCDLIDRLTTAAIASREVGKGE